jgi:very-short-patch-repair endonuclease
LPALLLEFHALGRFILRCGVLSTARPSRDGFRRSCDSTTGMLGAMSVENTSVRVLSERGKITSAAFLKAAGVTTQDIKSAMNMGLVQRVRRGVYCLPDVHPMVRIAAAHGGALTCVSLLSAWGIWMLKDSSEAHVWLGHGGRQHEHPDCSCVPHYSRGRGGIGAVSIVLALIHLYVCQGMEAFICAFESAWNQGKLNAAAREKVRAGLPKNARWLVDYATNLAASGLETLIRFRLRHFGFKIVAQYAVGSDEVDLLIEDVLLVEADGKANHDGPSKRHKDLMRDARTSSRGYETLRFDYSQIVYEWPMVLNAILAGLERAKGRI